VSPQENVMRGIVLVVLGGLLTSCGSPSSVNQEKICLFTDDTEAKKCKPGELAFFRPQSWGNDQLPLNGAAVYCDFNHQVMTTKGGFICVFTDKRLHLLSK
jgi:hypothetical protein